MIRQTWKRLQDTGPLIHCITNFVSANDVANGLLAVGASPVMARAVCEVGSFAAHCDALLLNLGTPDETTLQSCSVAGAMAASRKVPVVLDPVGVASSSWRRDIALELLQEKIPSIIRGNGAEIDALVTGQNKVRGVDGASQIFEAALASATALAVQGPFVVVSSGAIDIVSDGRRCGLVHNGREALRQVTGTGCLLSALIAASAASSTPVLFAGAITACCALGVCAERAWKKAQTSGGGTMTFRHGLIDSLSQLSPGELEQEARYEIL